MRFNNIQILRVVAALGVVAIHLSYYAVADFRADLEAMAWVRAERVTEACVPLLFAVSGFVLTHVLQSAPTGRYLLGRAIRIYPGYWLAMFVAACLKSNGLPGIALPWMAGRVTAPGLLLLPAGQSGVGLLLLGSEWTLFYEMTLAFALGIFALFGARRAVPIAAGVWAVVIAVRIAVWPNMALDSIPRWDTVLISAFNLPFLFGVLAYYPRNIGRRWRWAVLAATVGFAGFGIPWVPAGELRYCAWSVVAGLAMWLAVQFRQANDRNLFVRLGDLTYGLYLLHVPIILGVFLLLRNRELFVGSEAGVALAGLAAIVGGLLFGWVESIVHARLRPLAKLRGADIRTWSIRQRSRFGARRDVPILSQPVADVRKS
ncbi:acyltransferase family protein [Fimbriiglobus ruber]|uniref:Exopolysaccharide production protein ExoZ n=1 Tax=Fimbriiglobus ruber TaxID=1908690 RepID=A0A225DY66_9BACT|nr:acyltransferase [Fimbriiglobus ruber]OWK43478.1 Exopolysaccharide production protein ExoZ [Fimbriiglobus ruber]